MNPEQLSTTTNSGQQTATQNPQTAGQASPGGTPVGNVQPGTNRDLLSSPGSIQLHNQPLTTVNLTATSTVKSVKTAPVSRHFNGPLLLITVVLLVLAVVSGLVISRAAKNTTY